VKRHLFLLAAMAVLALAARGRADEAPRIVEIAAKRFEFVPGTITLKKGDTVTLRVTSEDVIHGLFLRDLKLDTDLEPGRTTELTVTPEKAGRFTAICHHYCGNGHGNMKLTIVVEE